MRLTFVVHQYPPRFFTGTEQYAHAVGRELQRRGHDVDVFTLQPDFAEASGPWRESREVVDGLPVRRINHWMWLGADWTSLEYRHARMAEVFRGHLRERRTELVHSFHLRHVGADLLDVARTHGAAVCVSLTDFWFLCPRVILMRGDGAACSGPPATPLGCVPCAHPELHQEVEQSLAKDEVLAVAQSRRGAPPPPAPALAARLASALDRPRYLRERLLAADAIIAPTRFLQQVFVQNGVPAARITCSGYGIDTAGLAPAPPAPRPLTFGFFGTFGPHKAPHLLVLAMAKVRGDCRAVLRGRQSDFPDYSRELVAAAASDPRVRIEPPFDRQGLAAALASIDVLVVPSTWHENAPFVVLEARAAGLPVLASRFGGLVEVVDDGVDGELFPPGDSDSLAERLQRCLDEPARLARYRSAVRPPKTLAVAVDDFEGIYRGARDR
ncbi:MAG: glycosyltransferase [Planctomycetes bacterium]|nr:glycosyltransferase [Planctomycetota bacterium]